VQQAGDTGRGRKINGWNVQIDLQIFSSVKLYYLEPGEELQNRVLIDSIVKAKLAVDTAKQKGFDHLSVIFAFPSGQPNK
jgi:hypothetical protein